MEDSNKNMKIKSKFTIYFPPKNLKDLNKFIPFKNTN